MYFNWRRFLADSKSALHPPTGSHYRMTGHRARVLAMFYFCMSWMAGSGRLGLAVDRVLFRGYRNVRVRAPLFIVGNFRSGSTLLHRPDSLVLRMSAGE